jgi:putative flippase GtrA
MQFFLYLIVGGLSFLVEIGAFVALRREATPVIPASVTSFILATIANYLLSILLAFQSGRFGRSIELMRFLTVVLVGLALNTGLVWCFVYRLGIQPTIAKISAVPFVLVWNYLGRRSLVFDDRLPVLGQSLLGKARLIPFAPIGWARRRSRRRAEASGRATAIEACAAASDRSCRTGSPTRE